MKHMVYSFVQFELHAQEIYVRVSFNTNAVYCQWQQQNLCDLNWEVREKEKKLRNESFENF